MSTIVPTRAWQRMLSGRRLDLLDPRPEDIAIEDIGHGLARMARWNGQTLGPHVFSVAQHSLLVEAIFAADFPAADPATRLAALLHDAAEYVVGDLISPFKSTLGTDYRVVEERVLAAIHVRFGLTSAGAAQTRRIKVADRAAARLEAAALAGFADSEATLFFGPPHPLSTSFEPFLVSSSADDVAARFLDRHATLVAGMHTDRT